MRLAILTTLLLLCTGLFGCSIHPYEVDIQQGNLLKDNSIAKLKPGMSQQQVRNLLGEPLLQNSLAKNIWTYVNTAQENGGDIKLQRTSVYFHNNKVSKITHG